MKMRTKISFVNVGWFVGGMERVTSVLANRLIRYFDVSIVFFGDYVENIFPLDSDVVFHHVDDPVISGVCDFVENNNTDLVIINGALGTIRQEICRELKRREIKFVIISHEYFFYSTKKISSVARYFNQLDVMKLANAVVFLTSFSLFSYTAHNDNGFLLPNPLTYPPDKQGRKEHGKQIIAVGRFNDPIKRVDLILKAFEELQRLDSESRLTLVGPFDKELQSRFFICGGTIGEYLETLEFDVNKIFFAGISDNVTSYYRDADVYWLTSDNEGFSLSLTEAGAFGLPSVITDINGLSDIVKNGDNGYIVPAGETTELAVKTHLILNDDQLYSRMSQRAVELANRFSVERIVVQWLRLIEKTLSNKPKEMVENFLSPARQEVLSVSEDELRKFGREYLSAVELEYTVLKEILKQGKELYDRLSEKDLENDEILFSDRINRIYKWLNK